MVDEVFDKTEDSFVEELEIPSDFKDDKIAIVTLSDESISIVFSVVVVLLLVVASVGESCLFCLP